MGNDGFRAGLAAAGSSGPRAHRADATGIQAATIENPWENQRFLPGPIGGQRWQQLKHSRPVQNLTVIDKTL